MNKHITSSSLVIILFTTLFTQTYSLGSTPAQNPSSSKWNPWIIGAAVTGCVTAGFGFWWYKSSRTNTQAKQQERRRNFEQEARIDLAAASNYLSNACDQASALLAAQPSQYNVRAENSSRQSGALVPTSNSSRQLVPQQQQQHMVAQQQQNNFGLGSAQLVPHVQPLLTPIDTSRYTSARSSCPSTGFGALFVSTQPGRKELFSAVAQRQHKEVARLMEANADLNEQDETGITVGHIAAQQNDHTMLQVLSFSHVLTKSFGGTLGYSKCNFDIHDHEQQNPLHLAVATGNLTSITTILDSRSHVEESRNAIINQKSATGVTPLHIAVEYEHAHLIKPLIDGKADMNAQNHRGVTPFALAMKKGKHFIMMPFKPYAQAIDKQKLAHDEELFDRATTSLMKQAEEKENAQHQHSSSSSAAPSNAPKLEHNPGPKIEEAP